MGSQYTKKMKVGGISVPNEAEYNSYVKLSKLELYFVTYFC